MVICDIQWLDGGLVFFGGVLIYLIYMFFGVMKDAKERKYWSKIKSKLASVGNILGKFLVIIIALIMAYFFFGLNRCSHSTINSEYYEHRPDRF